MPDFGIELIRMIGLVILLYYFICLFVTFLVVFGSLVRVARKMRVVSANLDLPQEALEPVSVLVPAYNEQLTIVETIRSLLRQDYPQFEIVVVNDGSRDETLTVLQNAFDLVPLESAGGQMLPSRPVRGTFISKIDRRILVIDKENGGKADALNAGVNAARFPLVCCTDADGIMESDTLKKLACHFARDETVVAVGGVVRPLNGSTVENGHVSGTGPPHGVWERIQVVEYLRAFLTGRFGWEKANGILIVSGALGMFQKQVLQEIGGYANTVGEDMELTLRIHETMRKNRRPYKIQMAVDAVCWTQVPDRLSDLRTQRIRWHKGLTDALFRHRKMLLNPRYGTVGMVSLPVFWLLEWLGPLIEMTGYCLLILLLVTGNLTPSAALIFAMAYLYGLIQSLIAVAAEDKVSRVYPALGDVLRLLGVCLIEPVLYRPLLVFWRCIAVLSIRRKAAWGTISRRQFSL